MTLPVLTAVTGNWEATLVAGLERSSNDVRVVRRCVDLAELLSAAAAGLGRAAVLSADLARLDREAVAQLQQSGLAVVGVTDPGDDEAGRRLLNLGIPRVVSADVGAAELALVVIGAVENLARHSPDGGPADSAPPDLGQAPGGGLARDLGRAAADPRAGSWGRGPAAVRPSAVPMVAADPADALARAPSWVSDAVAAHRPGGRSGRVVAVWGPTGSPGRTTVAVSLAAEFAQRGVPTLLVDADTYGPSVAQTLGLLDESGGIAGAVRAANSGALDIHRLARLAPCVSPTLRVLTGLPQPSRWPELRPSALEAVWQCARSLARWVVIDCGFCLETDEELTFDTSAPRRNGATLSALAVADTVLVVGSGDPVGLQRLVRGLSELNDAFGPAIQRHVVVTRVRAAAVGSPPERRIADALRRYAEVRDPWFVPDDRSALDEAMLAGRMLSEMNPNSPARRVFSELAVHLEEQVLADGLAVADDVLDGPAGLTRAGGHPSR
ncbi:MAG TPA: P-loop NTPase [Kineosporiaceae bacterium]